MKKGLIIWAVTLLGAVALYAQPSYTYTIDLTNVRDDKVKVELLPPAIDKASIEFQMPKIVPGTYSISDFGRFISEFKAFDKQGNEMTVEHDPAQINRWRINNAQQLGKITYWVDDTWDSKLDNHIFEPGGTNIQENRNFVLNTFGFFGYLEGMKEMPFKIIVEKPRGFYGSTALIAEEMTDTRDRFIVDGYNLLADSPMMYCLPDTAIKKVGNADVLVSVYSTNGRTSAKAVMEGIAPILEAQGKYLGGDLPVEKYAFICYLTGGGSASGGMGALEHSYSSFYFMPEVDDAQAGAMMKDVAAHEFFHIVTPLNVHSEEIHYFDYIDPKMSKHLWLYEGVTEYSASHVQVAYDLMSYPEYFATLQNKMTTAGYFLDTVPFTEISALTLDKYKGQYINVYQKGALIGMSLDIMLRDLSDGKMGLQDLLRQLEKEYGTENPFKDDELFDKIASLSYPEIREFFRQYVEGPNPLPYEDLLRRVGVKYESDVNRKILSMGRIAWNMDANTNQVVADNVNRMNRFGEDMGFEEGDILLEFAGMEVTSENFSAVVSKFRSEFKAGQKVKALVRRPDGNGGYKLKKLKGKAIEVRQRANHLLSIDPEATDRQVMIRKAWLNDL